MPTTTHCPLRYITVVMGVCASQQDESTGVVHSKQLTALSVDQSEKDKVAKQRRKLSVAPQHVGDIQQNNQLPAHTGMHT